MAELKGPCEYFKLRKKGKKIQLIKAIKTYVLTGEVVKEVS